MQYQKPGFIMTIASADVRSEKAGVNYLLKVREESNRWLLRHISSAPTVAQLQEAQAFIKEFSGISFDEQQLRDVLALFPIVRVELAVYGIERMETQDNLMDSVSNFFLGCTWPRMGDNVDMKGFISLLRRQAMAMGYESVDERYSLGQTHFFESIL